MKRKLVYVCNALLAVTLLSACGTKQADNKTKNVPKIEKQTKKTTKSTPKVIKPKYANGKFKSEYFEIDKFKTDYVIKPSSDDVAGSMVVNVSYTLKNISGKTIKADNEKFNDQFPTINVNYVDGDGAIVEDNGVYVNDQRVQDGQSPKKDMAPGQSITYRWSFLFPRAGGNVDVQTALSAGDGDSYYWIINKTTKHV